MKYEEFLNKTTFSQQDLLAVAHGSCQEDFPEDFGRLPAPPMLMLDRVTALSREPQNRFIIAEQEIRLDQWFFQCHFINDPVQPGCLGVDAIWQLMGLYAAAAGAKGMGRALGCKEVSFYGQIRPHNQLVRYEVQIRRFQLIPSLGTAILIGNGKVFVDGEHVYEILDAKVGTFTKIQYSDYPALGANAIGGIVQ